ncbi:hypothetical protein BC629DRAFT_619309 [Irpex lacteus]|nr:hypothetical protein BC629DRAFT_619309 [Irpex lacteus]
MLARVLALFALAPTVYSQSSGSSIPNTYPHDYPGKPVETSVRHGRTTISSRTGRSQMYLPP